MNQIEKAREYAEREHPVHKFIRDAAERAFIAGSKSGYSAGVKSGIEIARNNDKPENYYEGLSKGIVVSEKMQRYRHLKDIKEADAKYKLLAETFEEFLSDRVVIKELRDFWRKRAGLLID